MEHLFIVVTDPALNAGKFVAFNLTRSNGGRMAFTLQVGDHPFITRYPSDVNFGDGMIFDLATIANTVPHDPLDMRFVEAIAKKTIGHPAVPEEVEDMVKAAWKF